MCTYQAISGAGKTFETWPEMVDNVIPFIPGEEEKSESEPLKIWGTLSGGKIVPATAPAISAQCIRVPVSDGHMAAVSVAFERKPSRDQILSAWKEFGGKPQQLALPSAPRPFLHYFEDRTTGRRPGSIATPATARRSRSAGSAPIRSSTGGSSRCRTTPCAAPPAARC